MITLRGLLLVANGACEDGKRRFLGLCGIADVKKLNERELDIVCVAKNLQVARTVEGYLLPEKYLGWLVDHDLWFELTEQAGEPAVQAELVKRLSDASWDVRSAAATALSSQAGEPAVQAELVKRLSDEDGDVRCAAATALPPADWNK